MTSSVRRERPGAGLEAGTLAGERTLELRDVTFTHEGASLPTLVDVDLSVDSGTMLAVVGPSGSGKTSTLRVAAGLLEPDRGQVRVGGRDLHGVPPERRGMSMLFQRPLLFPHLDVLDNVAFAGRVAGRSRREARSRARDYLELVHLAELGGRRTRTLSGGQEQRVALARALAAEPSVLLLDEPFSSLDAGARAVMHDLLGEVRDVLEPTTVIVTHDMDEAALADRVAVVAAGRVQQVDSLAVLYRAPATLQVARVLGGFAEIKGHVDGGRHHSCFGVVDLAGSAGSSTGPATVLVRREALRATAPDSADSLFTVRVVAVRHHGLRQSVVVEPDGPCPTGVVPRMEVELDDAEAAVAKAGDRLGVARTGLPLTVLPG
ncbi:ABC transporter ATP-binding protein [Terracoccus luteus]|uniref:Putative spermidine/putrescine transport system ATP-binding protein n=1 Tax=Terracoccus luteus TaxID=53356 RepID=A0A839Q4J3_9MICO|nr:ABC transporter ATP-binding protein [Terracoccus luteus]MBB2988082.1 putative spermidine/putrescine transport system ATP-binding protein [Terracoccus luteus]MCP2173733.1 putative spermidine/putrescine transport system ATP-binding protein [Terracoccus luteus]